jgi:hypothetical protein
MVQEDPHRLNGLCTPLKASHAFGFSSREANTRNVGGKELLRLNNYPIGLEFRLVFSSIATLDRDIGKFAGRRLNLRAVAKSSRGGSRAFWLDRTLRGDRRSGFNRANRGTPGMAAEPATRRVRLPRFPEKKGCALRGRPESSSPKKKRFERSWTIKSGKGTSS